jgi:hypothetical protein
VLGTKQTVEGYACMTTTISTQDTEKMEALMDEMSITIRNLSSLAAAHGLLAPRVSLLLHDVTEGDLLEKPLEETLQRLRKVNEGAIPEWSFLNVG